VGEKVERTGRDGRLAGELLAQCYSDVRTHLQAATPYQRARQRINGRLRRGSRSRSRLKLGVLRSVAAPKAHQRMQAVTRGPNPPPRPRRDRPTARRWWHCFCRRQPTAVSPRTSRCAATPLYTFVQFPSSPNLPTSTSTSFYLLTASALHSLPPLSSRCTLPQSPFLYSQYPHISALPPNC